MYNSLKLSFKCFLNLSVPSQSYWFIARTIEERTELRFCSREIILGDGTVDSGTNERDMLDNAKGGVRRVAD